MLSIDDFRKYDKSIVAQKTIDEFNITIYFRKANEDNKFTISGRCVGFKQPSYICRANSVDECNSVFIGICEKITFLSKFQNDINMTDFFKELQKEYTPAERTKRFHETSDDGIISCYVNKQNDVYVPRIKDWKKGTNEYSQSYISPAVPTEKEAEDICRNCLNEYNIYGTYHRKLTKRICILEHEVVDDNSNFKEECYLYDNGIKTEITQKQAEKLKIMIENDLI